MADLSGIVTQLITERDRLNAAIAALEGISNGTSPRKEGHSKRTMSASARAKIASAQRRRWARVRAKAA